MEMTTPEKLFVCIFNFKPSLADAIRKYYEEGVPFSPELQAIRHEHARYSTDLSERGILWLGGPCIGSPMSMNIYAVDSVEEARQIQQNDPYSVNGYFYDDKYFEWVIHLPFGMVSPVHRQGVEEIMRGAGIIPRSH